jgi:hypothetical protein
MGKYSKTHQKSNKKGNITLRFFVIPYDKAFDGKKETGKKTQSIGRYKMILPWLESATLFFFSVLMGVSLTDIVTEIIEYYELW